MARLLQRQPVASEIVRNLGPVPDPKEWTKARTGDVRPLYAEIATLAKADRLRDVKGTTKDHINSVMRADRGQRDVKPGLNFVAKVDGKAQTGFVDGQGVFHGPHLPVSLDGPLPTVAVILGPVAFQHGKDGALGTLRHEMKHAEHFEMMIDWLAKWRRDMAKRGKPPKLDDATARTRFDAWIDGSKGLGKVERSLLVEERAGHHHNTELLAYVEGFINIFHLRQDPPSFKIAVDYPPAIYQLRRAGEEYAHASSQVRTAAMDRLRDYAAHALTVTERTHLRTWLTFLHDNARSQAKNPPAGDAAPANLLHKDFKPLAGFLKQVLALLP